VRADGQVFEHTKPTLVRQASTIASKGANAAAHVGWVGRTVEPARGNPSRAPRSELTGMWRVSENEPDSDRHAVSRDPDTVIRSITAHPRGRARATKVIVTVVVATQPATQQLPRALQSMTALE
jgi:hypothetical protein